MDNQTLIASMDFARNRLLGTLDAIEESGREVREVLAWRPGPGRAHIGWQAMHCAATHDRYLNVGIRGGKPADAALVGSFAGGTTPSDDNVPDLATARRALDASFRALRDHVSTLESADFERKLANGRAVGESLVLLTWHEAHHQGQVHLTWNLYRQAHGVA